jgi:hypothetical protein
MHPQHKNIWHQQPVSEHARTSKTRRMLAMQAIADQLRGGDMHIDFDQIFAKRASSADSAFLW